MKRRIRIAHIITNFNVGGAQDYLFLVMRGLDQTRYEPYVLGRMEGEWVSIAQSIPGVQWNDVVHLRREISPMHDVLSIFEIRRFCKQHRIDILHTHSSKPGVVGRIGGFLAKTPVIIHTIHGFAFHEFMGKWKKRMYILLEKWMTRGTTTLLMITDENRKTAGELNIVAKESVETIYYGIVDEPFASTNSKSAIRHGLGLTDENFVVGFTGRFTEQKGLDLLVRSFARFLQSTPEARLLLVGDGPVKSELVHLAADLRISASVSFTGFREDIARVLTSMDVFVMTSRWEGLSRSLAEAMFARLPVVATDVGGTREAIGRNERGWLVPPEDLEGIVRALVEIRRQPALASQRADAGQDWAKGQFNVQRMNENMMRLYERLFQKYGDSTPGALN